ncbi:MAG: rhomboid family intramembrane serine protease [Planctomycetota bacterium]
MFIPLGTDRSLRRTPVVTRTLIVLLIVAYGLQLAAGGTDSGEAVRHFILARGTGLWTFVTYAFLHADGGLGDILHIVGNIVILWVFGPSVEDRFGRVGFSVFYVVGAVAAGVLHTVLQPNPVIGASGAISAVTGAYLVLFPLTRIRTLIILVIVGVYMVPSWFFIGLAIAKDLIGLGVGAGNVAVGAHLGGYAFGGGLSLILLGSGLLKREQYDLFNLARHQKRKQDFRAASRVSQRKINRVMQDNARRASRGDSEGGLSVESKHAAEARAAVSSAVSDGRLDDAAELYGDLLEKHPLSATLSRDAQYRLAAHLISSEKNAEAAGAFARFLDAYPTDRDAPEIRLLLGRIYAHALDDPRRAAPLFKAAAAQLADDDHRAAAAAEHEAALSRLKETA